MTKNLFILSLFIFISFNSFAQCTPDNSIVKPGFYPAKLPDAVVGIAYNEVIQFKVLKDTTVIVFGNPTVATVDSATITNVMGIPNGLTFVLNKISQTYTPAEVGCALVSGTATKADTFKLKICLMIFAKVAGFAVAQPDTIRSFSIIVKGSGGTHELTNVSKSFYPNPISNAVLSINTDLVKPGNVLSIYNGQGQCMAMHIIDAFTSTVAFDYPKGLYYIALNKGNTVSRIKLIKN